jgi:uncharacterized protein
MEYLLIPFVALVASGLTLFSGFGLGTLLSPAFALFFPVDVAIALTAVVHLLNNLFKLVLLGKHADRNTVLAFGIPSVLFAFGGALLLKSLSSLDPIASYTLGANVFSIYPVKVLIAFLMAAFALFDLLPALSRLSFDKKYLPLGGALTGFFGGLSGHQGALRSAFLVKSGLSKESFIATGVVIACMVDVTRISVYSKMLLSDAIGLNWGLVALASGFAFLGAFLGNRLLKKVTLRTVQYFVAVFLLLIAAGLGLGLI